MFHIPSQESRDPDQQYRDMLALIDTITQGENDRIANLANAAAVLYHMLPHVNWAGFYLLKNTELVLGPFQGKPACIRIAMGRGVCGSAALQRSTVIVHNVHEFPGHIACDAASASEIVVPMMREAELLGVLDVDSPLVGRFQDIDRFYLERIVALLVSRCPA